MRSIAFKIFNPGNKKFSRYVVKAPRGKYFTEQGIETAIKMAAEHVERLLPTQEYRFVVTTGGYSFVWVKEREKEDALAL